MKCLRIRLYQKQAHYRKEESITNKMTYPLPPASTVIGALHKACGYETYHPMNVSIQGKYESLQKEPYTDHAFLNSTMDDRGILIKLQNPNLLNAGFHTVAKAQKSQGNSFREGITIQVVDREDLEEYRELYRIRKDFEEEKKGRLDPQVSQLKLQIKDAKEEQKKQAKDSEEFLEAKKDIEILNQSLKNLQEDYKKRKEEQYDKPYGYFANVTKSLRYYEILYEVELVLHVDSDPETLQDIKDNIYNLQAIGRSEDFVDLIECKEASLADETDTSHSNERYSAYIPMEFIEREAVLTESSEVRAIPVRGTRYFMNKDYQIVNKQRRFNRKWVLYTSHYFIDDESEGVYKDDNYIVCFI